MLGNEGLEGREGNKAGSCWPLWATPLWPSTKQSWALGAQEGTTPLPSLPAGGRGTEHKHRAKRAGERREEEGEHRSWGRGLGRGGLI